MLKKLGIVIRKRVAIKNLVFVTGMILILQGCQSGPEKKIQNSEKVPVHVTSVQHRRLSPPIRCNGFLAAAEESKLSFKTGGIIDKITVNEGSAVKKGQCLASLKPDEIEAMVNQARSALDKARRDYQRVQNLFQDSVATLEQVQNAGTAAEVAESQYKIAQFNLEYSKISAPADGVILKILAEKNELIGPGYPVFLFGSGRKEHVLKVGLSDRDIVRCRVGDSASVGFDPYPERSFPGRIMEIAGAPDPMSGLFETAIRVGAVDVPLMTGFIGRAVLFPSDKILVSIVPMISLVDGSDHQGYIFTVRDSTAVRVPVHIAFLTENAVALKDSLNGIDSVVTDGSAYLTHGIEVQVIQ
ncbi:efflux RND transporter periplasmic adaptor subunit [bacterium]|nr:efflux RND transporter periplasmic adaptor subunit [bacterium]